MDFDFIKKLSTPKLISRRNACLIQKDDARLNDQQRQIWIRRIEACNSEIVRRKTGPEKKAKGERHG